MKANTLKKYSKKSTPQLRKLAKFHFNKFIRLRDTDENGYGVCISSGQRLKYGTENAQAGHYWSGGKYPALEFNEHNVNLQGKSDNYFNGGNQLEYRRNLIVKFGKEAVEELDEMAAMSKRTFYKHSRVFLIEIIETYKQKCKELAKTKNFKI